MTYSLNTLNADRAAAPPSGIGRFAQELALVGGLIALFFALLSLSTHSLSDPAWSTTGTGGDIRNWGGRLGALLADGGYFLFGFSVWWFFLAGLRVWLAALARWLRAEPAIAPDVPDPNGPRWAWLTSPPMKRLGFWVLLISLVMASVVLEWGRLYRLEPLLPDHAGGALGQWLGPLAQR